ncbi:MAG: hypothetical protein JKY65_30525 [Planctomycetes bacterium]|nr:hypothetical protein [Planctomycetota bacterium]
MFGEKERVVSGRSRPDSPTERVAETATARKKVAKARADDEARLRDDPRRLHVRQRPCSESVLQVATLGQLRRRVQAAAAWT